MTHTSSSSESSQTLRSTHSLVRLFFLCLILATVFAMSPSGVKAATLTVSAGGDLQAALYAAQPGDEIVLEAGATFVGTFTLPNKAGASYITVRSSSESALPAAGVRVAPADAVNMPKIASPGYGTAALATEQSAHHYKFIGIEFKPVDANAFIYNLINLGDLSPAQNSLDKVPHHLILDRCYIHPNEGQELKRGIQLDSAETSIINCYIAGFHVRGQEAQAIAGFNGPGPFHIINNYLEGAGENLLFGGADAPIPNLIPSDIEIRGNYFYKRPEWRGQWFVIKNLLELKNAQRVVIDGNVMENNWADAQNGYAILFTTRNQDGGNPWAEVSDVQFTNNWVRHVAGGINVALRDDLHPSAQGHNVVVRNNLFEDINRFDAQGVSNGNGIFLGITRTINFTVDHNTIFNAYHMIAVHSEPIPQFTFTNNILNHGQYGVFGDNVGTNNAAINYYFPNSIFTKNVIVFDAPGADYDYNSARFPAGNYVPIGQGSVGYTDLAGGNYRLASNSPYKNAGTDGQDIGADIPALNAATATAISGGGTGGAPPPSYEGYHDGADCNVINGWAWDRNQPDTAISVDIYDGTTVIANNVVANQYRQDLRDAGKGNGYHGFSLATPASLRDGQPHLIRINYAGTSTGLTYTGKSITCTAPFTGTPVTVPGVIEAENFDNGGEGVAYHDIDVGNNGGVYRSTDVDVRAKSTASNSYDVFNAYPGEWLKYTINVQTTGMYDVGATVASRLEGGTFHIEVDGVDVTGSLKAPTTGSWYTFQYVGRTGVSLTAGRHVLRLSLDTAGVEGIIADFDTLSVTASSSSPFTGTPVTVPGAVEAENFDNGGEGVAYHDVDVGNNGAAYRSTDVDVRAVNTASNGYVVFNAYPGEWLKYTVNVTSAGTYSVGARVASRLEGGTFHIEVDGVNVTGSLKAPTTGSWWDFQTVSKSGVNLSAGTHVLRLVLDTAGVEGIVADFDTININ